MVAVAQFHRPRKQAPAPTDVLNYPHLWMHVTAGVVLGLLYVILFLPYATSLGLHADDWWDLYLAATRPLSKLVYQWPVDYRPFDQLPWRWAVHLFGTALPCYIGAYGAVLWATAITLYAIVYRITQRCLLALATTALWVVYPADGSIPWLSTTCYRAAALFFLLAVLCLMPRHSLSPWRYALALLCTACCLGSQELYLGLLALVPALAALVCPRKTTIARIQYALPFACLVVLYVVYRLWLGPHILHFYDVKSGAYDIHGAHIIKMLAAMLLVIGPEAWQVTFGTSRTVLGSPTAVFWFVGVIGSVAGVAALLVFAGRRWSTSRWSAHSQAIRPGVILAGVGLLGVSAGILPILPTDFTPAILGIDTRVNSAATIGAACVMMGLVWILAYSLPLLERRGRFFFVSIAIALIIVPAVRFSRIAQLYTGDWTAQRAFWHQMLIQVPSLRTHTFVVVVASDPAAQDVVCGQIRPWGMNSALALLYPNSDVRGTVAVLEDGRLACDHSPIPTTNVLVVQYATTPNRLVQPLQGPISLSPGIRRTSDPGRIVYRHVAAPWRHMVDLK